MAAHMHHGSAEIIQFPAGIFKRSRPLSEAGSVVSFRKAPETICYAALDSCWYHGEAVQNADKEAKRLD